jgi:hypothetical protein
VRDGIEVARRGRPAVALVTEQFWPQGDSVATAAGMPDVPRLRLPHPVAGTGHDAMGRVAESIAARIVGVLRGQVQPDNAPVRSQP